MVRQKDVVGCAIALAALLVLCEPVQVDAKGKAKEQSPRKTDGQQFCPASPIGKAAPASERIYPN
jgi:hypothetical protein